jgi:hypothetical protein
MKVATRLSSPKSRHEMPGNLEFRDPSRRVRSDLRPLAFIGILACAKIFRQVGGYRRNGSSRSLRDGHLASTFPGISCLATLSQSLRDNSLLNSSTRRLKNLLSTSFWASSKARL